MSEELIIEVLTLFIRTSALLSAPLIITAIVVGILVNVIQTVTQIKDQTLSFVPKVAAMAVVFVITVPWSIQIMQSFCDTIFALLERATS